MRSVIPWLLFYAYAVGIMPGTIHGKKYIEIVSILDSTSALSCLLKVHSILHSSLYPNLFSFNFLLMHERHMNQSEWNQAFTYKFPGVRFDTKVWIQPPSLAAIKLSGNNFATDVIFSRFYLPMIFSNISRFIYLDNDVVVTADLRTLYSYRLVKTSVIPDRDPFLYRGKSVSSTPPAHAMGGVGGDIRVAGAPRKQKMDTQKISTASKYSGAASKNRSHNSLRSSMVRSTRSTQSINNNQIWTTNIPDPTHKGRRLQQEEDEMEMAMGGSRNGSRNSSRDGGRNNSRRNSHNTAAAIAAAAAATTTFYDNDGNGESNSYKRRLQSHRSSDIGAHVPIAFVYETHPFYKGYLQSHFNVEHPMVRRAMETLPEMAFLNGGVFMVNADLWRDRDLTSQAEKLLAENMIVHNVNSVHTDGTATGSTTGAHTANTSSTRSYSMFDAAGVGDQGLFYVLFGADVGFLPACYNMRRLPKKTINMLRDGSKGIIHFAGVTHGDALHLCRNPLSTPIFLESGAMQLYLSIIASFEMTRPRHLDTRFNFYDQRQDPSEGKQWQPSECELAINTVKNELKRSSAIKTQYDGGLGEFTWPPPERPALVPT